MPDKFRRLGGPKQSARETSSLREATRWDRGRTSSNRWREYAIHYLRDNPLCRACEAIGELTPATQVDHIKPVRDNPELEWDETNHQPLCRPCHGVKTRDEMKGRVFTQKTSLSG